jgi:hypothetical protein
MDLDTRGYYNGTHVNFKISHVVDSVERLLLAVSNELVYIGIYYYAYETISFHIYVRVLHNFNINLRHA